MKNILLLILLLLQTALFAQKQSNWVVVGINGDTLQSPFAGGMNNCQFGELDLNLDGTSDLIVFDRNGNRLLPFINKGIANTIAYKFAPQYIRFFPEIHSWMQLHDYDGDADFDIFTYTTGGIKVFRNNSSGNLHFEQVTFPYITSLQGSGSIPTNILVTNADYPAVVDVDGDGDLDILSFWGMGSFIEWHKNLSMEKYGNKQQLEFKKESSCWGEFSEGIEGNLIQLDTCLPTSAHHSKQNAPKHTGSTLFANDLTGDGLMDLVLGDVDYETLFFLKNGGTISHAKIISFTTDFPSAAEKIELASFPLVNLMDVNNDGLKDLIVAPFSPDLELSKNSHNILLYQNTGTATNPTFTLNQNDFLQRQMLDFGSGDYPAFFDYNADGLLDLVVGNYGYLDTSYASPIYTCQYSASLALLKNIGTQENPVFKLVSTNWLNLAALNVQGLTPTFADVDGDDDLDLICGNASGSFIFYENIAPTGAAAAFDFRTQNWKNIKTDYYSAPQFVDVDGDTRLDLISGNLNGTLVYFKNTGTTTNPEFTHITDTLGSINVADVNSSYYGYSTPCFFKQPNGEWHLYVGSEQGKIFSYSNIVNNWDGKFTTDGVLDTQNDGWRTALAIRNIDADVSAEILVGNYAGGLSLYKGIQTIPWSRTEPEFVDNSSLVVFPNPANETVSITLKNTNPNIGIRQIEVWDLLGRKVMQQAASADSTIDTSKLNAGAYILKCQLFSKYSAVAGVATAKLIVKH